MNQKTKITITILILVFIGVTVLWVEWDNPDSVSKEAGGIDTAAVAPPQAEELAPHLKKGKQLAEKYCSTCHTYPEPALLDKQTWVNETLPNMGPRFGIFTHNGERYPTEKTANLPQNFYPDRQVIADSTWQHIIDYYRAAAPEALPEAERQPITIDEGFFEAHAPEYRDQAPPLVTAIRMDPVNKTIYFGDAAENKFYIFDRDLNFEARFSLSSPVSDIRMINERSEPGRRELMTTYIGDLNPSDALKGFIQPVWYNPVTGRGGAGSVIEDSLARPVETRLADLNEDGADDLLVSEFGHRTGSLFWLAGTGQGSYGAKRNILIDSPGCIETEVTDYTGNGHPDVIALCSQLDQAIYLFENRGGGNFNRTKLLQFEIVAGSSSFKLHDFNDDGRLDILYTSGDNADYSIIYKPYHGVYIYLNKGHNQFEEKWFYPINGAYDAIPRDFDKDGDTDLASIAFFADYDNTPREGFVFFENEGKLSFNPYHHPGASGGRWIAIDVADWTGNGLDDIILANFSLGPTRVKSLIQKKFSEGPHFVLLENKADTSGPR